MATKINKYEAIAPQILELVGGKDNIRSFVHCMTRLRFNVKDKGLVDAEKIGKLPGCMGTQWAGDQLQVIIGQSVDKAYDAICAAGDLKKEAAVDENLDEGSAKKKLSLTTVCEAISGCIVPLIPLFMASGLIKVVMVLANLVASCLRILPLTSCWAMQRTQLCTLCPSSSAIPLPKSLARTPVWPWVCVPCWCSLA